MNMQTRTITLRSEQHFGKRVPPVDFGEILRTLPNLITQSIRMSFEGRSRAHGPNPSWLKRASDIRFVDYKGDDDTVLYFETPILGESASELYEQEEFWSTRPDPADTGFDLIADIVNDVRDRQSDSVRFDRPLLRTLHNMGHGLNGAFQECLIDKRRGAKQEPAVIDHFVMDNADLLSKETPKPQQVRIAGELDMIRASTSSFAVRLANGQEVRGILARDDIADLADLFKKQVLVLGKAVYRASGNLLRVDAIEVRPMESGDEFFSTLPEARPSQIDLRNLRHEQKKKGGVAAIIGHWPGDETDEQVEMMLQEMS